jgi:hypothetical protein
MLQEDLKAHQKGCWFAALSYGVLWPVMTLKVVSMLWHCQAPERLDRIHWGIQRSQDRLAGRDASIILQIYGFLCAPALPANFSMSLQFFGGLQFFLQPL